MKWEHVKEQSKEYARTELQAQNIYNYSTSFGAYITLRYLIEQGNPFKKIALRSPGVNMYESMSNHVSDEGFAKLKKGKEIQVGFDRKMKIDQAFMDDLKSFNVRDHEYFDCADDILILHGTKDEMIPIDLVRDFAENISIGVVAFSSVGFFTAILEPLINGRRISLREVL